MTEKKPKIKIFVSHHKPWYIYQDDVYTPIQVWKKNAKIDLWILWDDTWDNISDKNGEYAELTAHYDLWVIHKLVCQATYLILGQWGWRLFLLSCC